MRFAVEYPDRSLDRLTTFFRIFTVIPIAIVLSSIGGYQSSGYHGEPHGVLVVHALSPFIGGKFVTSIRPYLSSRRTGVRVAEGLLRQLVRARGALRARVRVCLLYTSDAADE